jgi:hypothetical protein
MLWVFRLSVLFACAGVLSDLIRDTQSLDRLTATSSSLSGRFDHHLALWPIKIDARICGSS